MDITRCPKCKKRLMAMTDSNGRTDLRCPKCDKVEPPDMEAVRTADGPATSANN
jgi:ssDNA-binding Zn-finger/Zn-ribbon topoisomerase 1